jgi:hypothetical protein
VVVGLVTAEVAALALASSPATQVPTTLKAEAREDRWLSC